MTFIKWLRQQEDRNGPIGDLARDFSADVAWMNTGYHRRPLPRGKQQWHNFIGLGACEGAHQAVDAAYAEWTGCRKRV